MADPLDDPTAAKWTEPPDPARGDRFAALGRREVYEAGRLVAHLVPWDADFPWMKWKVVPTGSHPFRSASFDGRWEDRFELRAGDRVFRDWLGACADGVVSLRGDVNARPRTGFWRRVFLRLLYGP